MQCLAKGNVSIIFCANPVWLGRFIGYLLSITREFGQKMYI